MLNKKNFEIAALLDSHPYWGANQESRAAAGDRKRWLSGRAQLTDTTSRGGRPGTPVSHTSACAGAPIVAYLPERNISMPEPKLIRCRTCREQFPHDPLKPGYANQCWPCTQNALDSGKLIEPEPYIDVSCADIEEGHAVILARAKRNMPVPLLDPVPSE